MMKGRGAVAPLGTKIFVLRRTPSRMGIMTSRTSKRSAGPDWAATAPGDSARARARVPTQAAGAPASRVAAIASTRIKVARSTQGRTAAHGAALWGLTDVVRFLQANGARLDAMDKRGFTPLDTALELERKAYAWLRSTHDYAEGVTAFLEKRPPRYTGR